MQKIALSKGFLAVLLIISIGASALVSAGVTMQLVAVPVANVGPQGDTGATGATGPTGNNGTNGINGISCWDLNGNGVNDPAEDINADFQQ